MLSGITTAFVDYLENFDASNRSNSVTGCQRLQRGGVKDAQPFIRHV